MKRRQLKFEIHQAVYKSQVSSTASPILQMIIHRYLLLVASAFELFAPVDGMAGVVVAVGVMGGKKILKKIGEKLMDKVTDKVADQASDSMLSAICLAAGMKNKTDELSIKDLSTAITRMNSNIDNRLNAIEYNMAMQQYHSDIDRYIFRLYSHMETIIKREGDVDKSIEAFNDEIKHHKPITLATDIYHYLDSKESSLIGPAIQRDTIYGGSKVLFREISRQLDGILNRIRAITAFQVGWSGEFNVTNWLNERFENKTDVEDINKITEEFIAEFNSHFPSDVRDAINNVATWMKNFVDDFHKTKNRYWENGNVEIVLEKVVLPKVLEDPKFYMANTSFLGVLIRNDLGNISTYDVLDILISYNDIAVLRNDSNAVKQYSGFKKSVGAEVFVFRSKPDFVVTKEQAADMERYHIHDTNKMNDAKKYTEESIKKKSDSVKTIIVGCKGKSRPNEYANWSTINRPESDRSERLMTRPFTEFTGYHSGCDKSSFNGVISKVLGHESALFLGFYKTPLTQQSMRIMRLPIQSLLLFFLLGYSTSSTPDDSLPVYLRGLEWNKVQEYVKEDLRLSDSVLPTNYAIELSVNVRGHAGATKSDFNGTVFIYLNFTKSVDKIELHSNGLAIEKAELMEILIGTKPVGVSNRSSDEVRETITIHTNRTIQQDEKIILKITYSGVAKMDEYGLYENWDPKFNESLDSNGPYILATNNFPTGARFWFPCFDEPEKKATFELKMNHPSGLNAYSNSKLERRESAGDGRTVSVFEKTGLLSTYQVALSINHLSSQYLDVKGFGKVQLVRSMNSHDYWSSDHMAPSQFDFLRDETDIPSLLKLQLEKLNSVKFGEIPKGKLDIIILEGTKSNSIQPGLITIGRSNLWSGREVVQNIPDLVRIRSQFSVKTSNQIWLNTMLAHFSTNKTSSGDIRKVMDLTMLESSLHERPLRDLMEHPTSTKQFLASRMEVSALKGSQMLRLLIRYCPTSEEALKKYVANSIERIAEIDTFIDELSKNCHDAKGAREYLESFIDQPGRALLTVKRKNDSVIIKQMRYQSSYFDSSLRDNKTRYTIPLFFTVDGEYSVKLFPRNETQLEIRVPETSTFYIDHNYEQIYFAFFEDVVVPQKNMSTEERKTIALGLQKSMLAALHVGFVKYNQLTLQMKEYMKNGLFKSFDYWDVYSIAKHFDLFVERVSEYREEQNELENCESWYGQRPDWNGAFNNGTKYWRNPTEIRDLADHINCVAEWANATEYGRFLERNFLGENTAIRPIAMHTLADRIYGLFHWRDFHRFFFRNAPTVRNHRFNLLADAVLNRPYVQYYPYPNPSMREDYLTELRKFVIANPRRAASMSTEIEKRLEREYLRKEMPKWHNEDRDRMLKDAHLTRD